MEKDYYLLDCYASTHVGKVRTNNEDNYLFYGSIVDDTQKQLQDEKKSDSQEINLFGVFDGMGGHEFGERASFQTADFARHFMLDEDMICEGMEQICLQANQLVCMEMRQLKLRIGTTASMLAFYKKNAYVCNIGDTPIYLLRNHKLIQLHEEHTERKMYEKIYGQVDPKKKYRLTQNIGVFEEEMMIKPYTSTLEMEPDDIYLICSDGLTDMVGEAKIVEVLESKDRKNKLKLLEETALEAGGRDNITMILVHVDKRGLFNFFRK